MCWWRELDADSTHVVATVLKALGGLGTAVGGKEESWGCVGEQSLIQIHLMLLQRS